MRPVDPYEVADHTSGDRFYVLAASAEDAIERVSLALRDAEGARTWQARQASGALLLVEDVVFDASGRPVRKSIA